MVMVVVRGQEGPVPAYCAVIYFPGNAEHASRDTHLHVPLSLHLLCYFPKPASAPPSVQHGFAIPTRLVGMG